MSSRWLLPAVLEQEAVGAALQYAKLLLLLPLQLLQISLRLLLMLSHSRCCVPAMQHTLLAATQQLGGSISRQWMACWMLEPRAYLAALPVIHLLPLLLLLLEEWAVIHAQR